MKQVPIELEPVLAKISHQNDLGSTQWYEVVYYVDGKWCSYSGSKTFDDGERVVEWVYCSEQFKQQEHEDILCNCSQGKGIDFDEMGVEYCVSCQKQIN